MECKFTVGQKVVCINASGTYNLEWKCPLIEGQIYEISWIGVFPGYAQTPIGSEMNPLSVKLKGIKNPDLLSMDMFGARRFLPLEETQEKVSEAILLFRRIADGVTKGSPVVDDPVYVKRLTKEHQS